MMPVSMNPTVKRADHRAGDRAHAAPGGRATHKDGSQRGQQVAVTRGRARRSS